jgi:hypothetical protein
MGRHPCPLRTMGCKYRMTVPLRRSSLNTGPPSHLRPSPSCLLLPSPPLLRLRPRRPKAHVPRARPSCTSPSSFSPSARISRPTRFSNISAISSLVLRVSPWSTFSEVRKRSLRKGVERQRGVGCTCLCTRRGVLRCKICSYFPWSNSPLSSYLLDSLQYIAQ